VSIRLRNYFFAVTVLVFLFYGKIFAQTPQSAPLAIKGSLSVVYDDNVFAYSDKIQGSFRLNPTRLYFREQNANSLGDMITKPSFQLNFSPKRYPSTHISAELYGSFYKQNATLNDRGYFAEIAQGLSSKTELSISYNESFSEFSNETFRAAGVDLQHDFQIFDGNLFAEKTDDDKDYGAGLETFIENRYFGTTLSYQFDQNIPNDSLYELRSHQFTIEPIFSITEALYMSFYAHIQKEQYTNDVREDTTRGFGFLVDYAMREHFVAQLGFDRILWQTDKQMRNPSYEKKIITVRAVVSF